MVIGSEMGGVVELIVEVPVEAGAVEGGRVVVVLGIHLDKICYMWYFIIELSHLL